MNTRNRTKQCERQGQTVREHNTHITHKHMSTRHTHESAHTLLADDAVGSAKGAAGLPPKATFGSVFRAVTRLSFCRQSNLWGKSACAAQHGQTLERTEGNAHCAVVQTSRRCPRAGVPHLSAHSAPADDVDPGQLLAALGLAPPHAHPRKARAHTQAKDVSSPCTTTSGTHHRLRSEAATRTSSMQPSTETYSPHPYRHQRGATYHRRVREEVQKVVGDGDAVAGQEGEVRQGSVQAVQHFQTLDLGPGTHVDPLVHLGGGITQAAPRVCATAATRNKNKRRGRGGGRG